MVSHIRCGDSCVYDGPNSVGCGSGYVDLCPCSGWESEIDIQKTIQLVRAQRSGMVQTEVSVFCTSHYVTC